jgi:glycerol-3-phosphate cytidylyltransferase-like family protein
MHCSAGHAGAMLQARQLGKALYVIRTRTQQQDQCDQTNRSSSDITVGPLFSRIASSELQARQLGKALYVGIHSDEAILENKGPTVMSLEECIN